MWNGHEWLSGVIRPQSTEGCQVQGLRSDLHCESHLVPTVSCGIPCRRAGV